jgi:uncharacterized protein (UPF0128 family)
LREKKKAKKGSLDQPTLKLGRTIQLVPKNQRILASVQVLLFKAIFKIWFAKEDNSNVVIVNVAKIIKTIDFIA